MTFVCMLRTPVLAFALLSVTLTAAFPQMHMGRHVMQMQDEIPPEKLPPAIRMFGIGNAYMEITAAPEAEMWFNQGLNLLHDFWEYESARAFQQGVRIDPQCAMCYWGLYKALSMYHSTAQGYAGQALAQAVALKHQSSARERLYIEAAAAHEEAKRSPNPESLYLREQKLLGKLVADHPKDLQARIFLATAGGKDSLAMLESVLKEDPENSAANHHYIHFLEATDHPEKALHSAAILGRLAPASGHMVHMPGHIYYRLGDYARAAQAFAASLSVDERYMREQHVEPDNNWNYVHNLMYSVANLLEQGKFKQATDLSARITRARGKLETTLYISAARDSISRLDPRLPVALRTADFEQVLKLVNASAIPADLPNLEFLRLRLADFASGMNAVSARHLSQAEQLSLRFDAELWRMSQQHNHSRPNPDKTPPQTPPAGPPRIAVMPDALLDPVLATLSIMSLELRGSIVSAQGKTDQAKALFASAAAKQKELGYREPPNYIRPVGETEGAAMLAAGKWAEAKAAFERALVDRPRSGFGLYGIARAIEQSSRHDPAVKAYADFLAAWKEADSELPQLAHARNYVNARRN